MTKPLGVYYLGATIATPEVMSRIQKYTDKVHMLFGVDCTREKERHVTLVPPFFADFETASRINLRCAMSTLLSDHPLVNTLFCIKGMSVMGFNGIDVVHFKVHVHQESKVGECFEEYVVALRKRFTSHGLLYREVIPGEFTPHMTVFVGKNLRANTRLQEILKRSESEEVLYFRSGYPTLYARYKDGWGDLRDDPVKN